MQWNRQLNVFIGILFILLLTMPLFFTHTKQYLSIPNQVTLFQTESSVSIPKLEDATVSANPLLKDNRLYPQQVGESSLYYKWGNIPVKKVDVTVFKQHEVIPGGQSIGVQLHTLGVLVVGHHLVSNSNEGQSPGEIANIKVGDIIVEMNGQEVKKLADLKEIVQRAGKEKKPIDITLRRGKDTIKTKVNPKYNKRSEERRVGKERKYRRKREK